MSAPPKQSMRWGNFLQQAVAGVESRLDNMLAEPDEQAKSTKPSSPAPGAKLTPGRSENMSRASSTKSTRGNDRLQERLARAVAAKNAASQKPDASPRSSTDIARAESPALSAGSPRTSVDVSSATGEESNTDEIKLEGTDTEAKEAAAGEEVKPEDLAPPTEVNLDEGATATVETSSTSPRPSAEVLLPDLTGTPERPAVQNDRLEEAPQASGENTILGSTPNYKELLDELQDNYAKSEIERQEEIHGYIEKIDALQAKLQYLARESAESARNAAKSATAGSMEKKLAERDEQISLLMEEGQRLSKTELKHATTIKQLRHKIAETAKGDNEVKKKLTGFQTEKSALLERIRRAELFEKQSNEKSKTINKLQKELESVKTDRDGKDQAIADLKVELEASAAQARDAEVKAVVGQLETEKKRSVCLEEELSSVKIEKDLAADEHRVQLKDLQDKLERDAERHRVQQVEMTAEQQMLESKLELMRARAEEVSSGSTGDAQAKLLRQIETLQTQYSVASENWQGIEASLISRATALEKERDEAARREGDMRRKAREMAMKSKRAESDLEASQNTIERLQKEVAKNSAEAETLKKRVEDVEKALADAKKAFDEEKDAWRIETQRRVDEERTRWRDEFPGGATFSRAESPMMSMKLPDFLSLHGAERRKSSRSYSGQGVTTPSRISEGLPQRQDSMQSLSASLEVPLTPSITTMEPDEMFDRVDSPRPQTINDMISVSTVGAGPSVQLVERMSAAVRRLEGEKVATKEEISRLTAQRDNARAEVLGLMAEADSKRSADVRIAELESQLAELDSRYQTTLELLGEKSELVEELRADVQDVKQMYRELVERTVR